MICLGGERFENRDTHALYKERIPETELYNQAVRPDVTHIVNKSDFEKIVFVDKPLDKLKSKPSTFV